MDGDITNFYATAAQVIPALLILLVIESRFMTAIRGYRGLDVAPGEVVTAVELSERAAHAILPVVVGGLPARFVLWTLRFFYLRPTRLSNGILVVGTVFWPLFGEGLAFASLVHAPAGLAKRLIVTGICVALAILLVESLVALLWLSFSSVRPPGKDPGPDRDAGTRTGEWV